MTLEFEKEYDYTFPFDEEMLARQVIDAVLDQEGCPYECEVSLVLSGEAEIQEANRNFRQIDRVTDVLSFPMQPFPAPARYDFLEEADDAFHPETGELLHLLGYDHMTPEEAAVMEAKQNQVLNELKITRGDANEN